MKSVKLFLYGLIVLMFILHNDWWLWENSNLWLGLPAGLTYHIIFCLAVTGLMALLVKYAWPFKPNGDEGGRS